MGTTEYATMDVTELEQKARNQIDQMPVETRGKTRELLDALVERAKGGSPTGTYADVEDVDDVHQAIEKLELSANNRQQIEPLFDALVERAGNWGKGS